MNSPLYITTLVLLGISLLKSRKKTLMALKKAWKSFQNILPQLISVLLLVGIMLAAFKPETISRWIGPQSGFLGVVISAVAGAVTLIPGFIAFPTAALLADNGAGMMQIAAFVSSLMMVGVVSAPVESAYFGKRLTLWRNLMAFLFSFLVAFVIGKVVG